MDIKINDKKKNVTVWPEKLFTQKEVDDSYQRGKDSRTSDVKNIQAADKSPEQEGKDEQTKSQATKKELDKQTVKDLVRMSNRCIYSISTQFPWNLIPSTIDIEEDRVTFIFRQFLSSQSHSVNIKDISNVFIESSLFSATLQVVSHTYVQNDIKIGHLNRKKAEKARRIIEGLRIFADHNINTSNYTIDELTQKIEEFHTTHKE